MSFQSLSLSLVIKMFKVESIYAQTGNICYKAEDGKYFVLSAEDLSRLAALAALCSASDMDMQECGNTELTRISSALVIDKIRAKQAAKPKFSPLAS